jgi:hypothetical protein
MGRVSVSLTILLFTFLVISVLGVTLGVLRKNKVMAIASLAVCISLIIFALFLMFVLIPAM